jgi:colicin import membrane protein
METAGDKTRALFLSVGVHAICVLLMIVGLGWTRAARPLSVPGPVIEATLVAYTPPASARKPQPRPRQAPPPRAQPTPEPVPTVTPVPPRADDTIDRQLIDRTAIEPSDAEREQEERRKREQEVLEEQERLARMEQERQQQLEDIRKQREQAEQRRKLEEQRLAQMLDREDRQRDDAQRKAERERMQELLAQEQRAGNEGQDEGLLSQYRFAIQNLVQRNWQRPDSVPERIRCDVVVTQIPGGDVIAVDLSHCPFDEAGQRSVEAALRREPLPYTGYEQVFARQLRIPFCHPVEECPR